jgi:hypothetical protein
VWERAEHELGVVQRRILSGDERHVVPAKADARPSLVVCGCKDQLERRSSSNECAKLAASIAAGPEHADWNSMHG